MPKYRLLLVEELVLSDCAEFHVEAASEAKAAALLVQARHDALDGDSNLVALPDGQAHNIEPEDVVRSRVFCVLLDDAGEEIREVVPDFGDIATACFAAPVEESPK